MRREKQHVASHCHMLPHSPHCLSHVTAKSQRRPNVICSSIHYIKCPDCREAAAILDAFAGLEAATDTADAQELQSALATAAAVDAPFVP